MVPPVAWIKKVRLRPTEKKSVAGVVETVRGLMDLGISMSVIFAHSFFSCSDSFVLYPYRVGVFSRLHLYMYLVTVQCISSFGVWRKVKFDSNSGGERYESNWFRYFGHWIT